MSAIKDWSTTAASNNSASPNGFPEGMAPSGVNDSAREVMAQVRSWYDDAEWREWGHTITYVSGTQFTTAAGDGDTTGVYEVGRRVRAVGSTTGTIYGRVTASSHSAQTTVTVSWDSGSLQSEALTVSVGLSQTGRSVYGTIRQVVSATEPLRRQIETTDTFPVDDSIPQITEGQAILSSAFTPLASTSTLRIEVVVPCYWPAASSGLIVMGAGLFVSTGTDALRVAYTGAAAAGFGTISYQHDVASASTTARTYSVRVGVANASSQAFVNGDPSSRYWGGTLYASMRITEIG